MAVRIFHVQDDVKREVNAQGLDFGTEVMVEYLDTHEVVFVPKTELRRENV
jgi:hypothetical protein